jgi:bacillopeptidase F (M6 metalloprotease family)
MWSSREDESDTRLTREFGLSRVTTATLNYWAWWKIETDYDYAYLEVSTDGGKTWKIIPTPSGTGANPAGSNMGWGYTGCSDGGETGKGCSGQWIEVRGGCRDTGRVKKSLQQMNINYAIMIV